MTTCFPSVPVFCSCFARCASTAEGFFDHLVFSRSQAAGQGALAVQAGLVTAYAPLFPHLAQIAAQEASYFDQHMNVYGGRLGLQNYDAYPNVWSNSANLPFATYLSGLVHASGGMSSLNHPFGPERPWRRTWHWATACGATGSFSPQRVLAMTTPRG